MTKKLVEIKMKRSERNSGNTVYNISFIFNWKHNLKNKVVFRLNTTTLQRGF